MCNIYITEKNYGPARLLERLFNAINNQERPEANPAKSTVPPHYQPLIDADRRYRHNGVNGWRFQGYARDGKILLTADVYKQIDLQDLRALNQELEEEAQPRMGAPYQIRRSSGSLEKFLFLAVNADTQKLMMIKPEGHTVSVSEEELAKENPSWQEHRFRPA